MKHHSSRNLVFSASFLTLSLIIFVGIATDTAVQAAAAGKSAVASGRGVKGGANEIFHQIFSRFDFMFFVFSSLYNTDLRKAGVRKGSYERRVMTSTGIRAGANTVVVDPPHSLVGVGVGGNAPVGSGVRRPEEAEAYYSNPYVTPYMHTCI